MPIKFKFGCRAFLTAYQDNALVAQMDRVSVSEAEGRGFDSRRARQIQTCGHKFFCRYSRAHSVPNLCPSRAHYFGLNIFNQKF